MSPNCWLLFKCARKFTNNITSTHNQTHPQKYTRIYDMFRRNVFTQKVCHKMLTCSPSKFRTLRSHKGCPFRILMCRWLSVNINDEFKTVTDENTKNRFFIQKVKKRGREDNYWITWSLGAPASRANHHGEWDRARDFSPPIKCPNCSSHPPFFLLLQSISNSETSSNIYDRARNSWFERPPFDISGPHLSGTSAIYVIAGDFSVKIDWTKTFMDINWNLLWESVE